MLVENTRSDIESIGVMQDLLEPAITPFSKGCKWNVNVEKLAIEKGFKKDFLRSTELGMLSLGVYKKL